MYLNIYRMLWVLKKNKWQKKSGSRLSMNVTNVFRSKQHQQLCFFQMVSREEVKLCNQWPCRSLISEQLHTNAGISHQALSAFRRDSVNNNNQQQHSNDIKPDATAMQVAMMSVREWEQTCIRNLLKVGGWDIGTELWHQNRIMSRIFMSV